MNKLSIEKRATVVRSLVECVGVNATQRLTGVCKPAILKLLADVGHACAKLHHDRVRGLQPTRIECDEIWSFVFCKEKSLREEYRGTFGLGDVWLWTAIDPDSKMIMSYHVGQRTPEDARTFMLDLAMRVNSIATLSTDGLHSYPDAVANAFGEFVNYGQIIKSYAEVPAKCTGCKKKAVIGAPRGRDLSTSIVERSNLTIRAQNKRFARLTLGHSKKVENHEHSIAIFMAFYNFCRPHLTLEGKTPAQACGLTDKKWTVEDLIQLVD